MNIIEETTPKSDTSDCRSHAKRLGLVAFACMLAVPSLAAEERLVRQPMPSATPAGHRAIPIMGRTYWTWSTDELYVNPLVPSRDWRDNAGFFELDAFKDSALDITAGYSGITPLPEGKATLRTMKDGFRAERWEHLEKNPKPNAPLILRPAHKRSLASKVGEIDLDYADYAAFKASHTNFWGFEVLDEWDNDLLKACGNIKRMKPSPLKEKLLAELISEQPKSRQEFLAFAKKYCQRQLAVNYGDTNAMVALRSTLHIDHLAAAWGAKHLILETTDTTGTGYEGYRWDVSAMFIRGAARQFHIPWSWYVAAFQNGIKSNGKGQNESYCVMPGAKGYPAHWGPWGGISASLEKRCHYFAFVNGSNGVQVEDWTSRYYDRGPTTGWPTVLSRRGRDFVDFHDFTREHSDRGDVYAPVALLVPFDEGYTQGGNPWGWFLPYDRRGEMVDAAFTTIVRARDRAKLVKERALETALLNSPYAQMYDVLVPDSPQPREAFLKALSAYPAAVLIGGYKQSPGYSGALVEYVKNGGTLFVNSAQVPGEFGEDVLGLSLGAVAPCGKEARDPSGKAVFSITGNYEVAVATLKTAKPLLMDENGRVLAAVNDYGKGRIVTTTPTYLAPRDCAFHATISGKRRHPFFDWIFARLQAELFPIKVTGNCLYGLNRTEKGWWLWTFNNDGVTKWADKFEIVDHACDTIVRVDASGLGSFAVRELVRNKKPVVNKGRFAWPVNAGEFAIFELVR